MKSRIAAVALLGLGVTLATPAPAALLGARHVGWDGEPSHHDAAPHPPLPTLDRYATPTTVYLSPTEVVPAVPTSPAFTDADGRLCRDYRVTLSPDDEKRHAYGTACQQVDGTWEIVGRLRSR